MSAPAAKPLHVGFRLEASAALRAEAARRRLRPQVLVSALVNATIAGGLFDAILDGADARVMAGGHARDAQCGLTLLQGGVLYLIGVHAGADGLCRLPPIRLGELLAAPDGPAPGRRYGHARVSETLAALRRDRLIARGAKLSVGGVQPWALTTAGKKAFAVLAGEEREA